MTKIFLVCSGLGHVHRGYESFTQECYYALANELDLEETLFKGFGPKGANEIALPCLKRHALLTRILAKILKRDPYSLEQFTFTMLLLPYLHSKRPQVIYFSDEMVGVYLFRWRKISGLKFQLMFSNGAPYPPPYPRWDHVQQVAPTYYEAAIASGEPEQKQSLLPYGFQINKKQEELTLQEKRDKRSGLGLPSERFIVLSVGALNKHHKRIDYLIEEIALLPSPRPFLVLLGQREKETAEIETMAQERLGKEDYIIRSVPHQQTADYYKIADIFVLASLREGLPRVLVEAMSFGLPCLTHDYAVTRYVLSEYGDFGNFEKSGGLSSALSGLMDKYTEVDREAIHNSAYERFSWAQLKSNYVDMLLRCAQGT